MILRDTLSVILADQRPPLAAVAEVERELLAALPTNSAQALVLSGVRRSGKSTLQAQLMKRHPSTFYCNFEDTRLFGLTSADFPTLLSLIEERTGTPTVFLDEVQEVTDWQRLVRALLDRGRSVCVTGSNASLLGRELGTKLTGRHLSFEVFPFSYLEYLAYTRQRPGEASLSAHLDDGGFPGYLRERNDQLLQELLRDILQRDIAARHGLRETRHVTNLALFLLGNTGQPLSLQNLTKALAVPTVGQTSRYVEFLQDAYLLFALPKFSPSFKQRVVSPNKFYAIDNGLRRANSPQMTPDRGHRLENLVYLALRRRRGALHYAGEKGLWECDFVTENEAIQVCLELTPFNRGREVEGIIRACAMPGKRRGLIVTQNQTDRFVEQGVRIDVVPAWRWLSEV
jgi:predicted AAA+ superfamily ATPase